MRKDPFPGDKLCAAARGLKPQTLECLVQASNTRPHMRRALSSVFHITSYVAQWIMNDTITIVRLSNLRYIHMKTVITKSAGH